MGVWVESHVLFRVSVDPAVIILGADWVNLLLALSWWVWGLSLSLGLWVEGGMLLSDWSLQHMNLLWLGRYDSWLRIWVLFASLLVVVIWFTLHDDILAEIFVAVHSGGEELNVWDARDTLSIKASINARFSLHEPDGRWRVGAEGPDISVVDTRWVVDCRSLTYELRWRASVHPRAIVIEPIAFDSDGHGAASEQCRNNK